MERHQLNLFTDTPIEFMPASKPETLVMDEPALVGWKSQIYNYQQQAQTSNVVKQTTLFDLTVGHCDPDSIDPFSLRLSLMSFYRLPADSPGDACIYFVIDNAAHLLLYVGETCRSNKRWKGTHDWTYPRIKSSPNNKTMYTCRLSIAERGLDLIFGDFYCKRYIEKYQQLHYQHQLSCAVNLALWWDAPVQALLRQQLEQALIVKWRSPFNQDNWERWGQPFG